MSWLLDTCAVSEYARKSPAPKVIEWLDDQEEASLFISVVTLGEIEKGILKLRSSDSRRSQNLRKWLGKVEQRFAGRILPLDAASFHAWAQLAANAESAGHPMSVMDGLIMAMAQCHGLTVVTRNMQDFAQYPQVFNPWSL
jgi:hypothetical protein